jgi:hypothetical protein
MALKHTISECPQVERLALLEKDNNKFYHILEGNGQEGIVKKVIRLEEKMDITCGAIERIEDNQEKLLGKISLALDYKKEQEAINRDRGIRAVHFKWLIGVTITLLLGVAGLTVNVQKEKAKLKTANQTILNEANENKEKDNNFIINEK